MLLDLKIATLFISETLRKRLVEVLKKTLDAFVASSTDFEKFSVVVQTIKTEFTRPIRYKLRAILLAQRQYIEQKVEKLISVGSIFPAD